MCLADSCVWESCVFGKVMCLAKFKLLTGTRGSMEVKAFSVGSHVVDLWCRQTQGCFTSAKDGDAPEV